MFTFFFTSSAIKQPKRLPVPIAFQIDSERADLLLFSSVIFDCFQY